MALLKGLFDLRRVWRAAGYSAAGFRAALKNEAAFRQELALFVVLAPLGFWLGRDGVERSLLVGSLLLVLLVELLNSAIESVVNRVGQDHHELSGQAKDIASAAVFISLLTVVVVWALVLTDRFL
ncbi:MAG: diacylglycerol kinase [Gammaproteobacteria bacterium]|nr:diacylglycerol kinase [Gammaproteobacteria bacterium]MDH3370745.1 diacylglycerol kinase [Gammaproteobacteria bacterium]MDH3406956.1 diacylglycerol kinase [Gammaproteobacteria bacterium]MDH3563097.1 diacylglycerol kinase [Gammaproteobacteria bacterium]